jgi:uracil-DNA glycosylase family 4
VNASSQFTAENYAIHVANCRACALCGLTNLKGCEHPSPWALWMGSHNARVVIVGQDFSGSDQAWREPKLDLPTNRNLLGLIQAAGLDGQRDVYLTNAILCLKDGKTSDPVRGAWVRNCAPLLRRTIDIIAPVAVAALGGVAWRALRYAFHRRLPPLSSSVGQKPVTVPAGPALFAFNHPGGLGLVRRPLTAQTKDWESFGDWLATVR